MRLAAKLDSLSLFPKTHMVARTSSLKLSSNLYNMHSGRHKPPDEHRLCVSMDG